MYEPNNCNVITALTNFHIVVDFSNYREIVVRHSLNGVMSKMLEENKLADLRILQFFKGQTYLMNNLEDKTIEEIIRLKLGERTREVL